MNTVRSILGFSAAFAVAASAGIALAQDSGPDVNATASTSATSADDTFKVWDSNTDANIDTDEWNVGWDQSNVFKAWDADGDGTLSQQEFEAHMMKDGQVDLSMPFPSRYPEASFASWDQDGNGSISSEEFSEDIRKGYDVSGDDRIDRDEWVDVNRDFQAGGVWRDDS